MPRRDARRGSAAAAFACGVPVGIYLAVVAMLWLGVLAP